MTLADDIRLAVYPYIGQPLDSSTIALVDGAIQDAAGGNVVTVAKGSKLSATVTQYPSPIAPSRQPPNTQELQPEDAALLLVEFAVSLYIGKPTLAGVERTLRMAIATDWRLYLKAVRVEGDTVTAEIDLLSPPQLIYDGISEYNGEYVYG